MTASVLTDRAAGSASAEVDEEIVRRLSALSEDSVLDYFWLMNRQDVHCLPLLLHLSKVVIARPSDWDRAAIRREHEQRGGLFAPKLDARMCFACWDSQNHRYFHHIVEVQHGGSNQLRNQVPLCFACHQYLHPWLTEEPVQRRVSGFSSLYEIGRTLVRSSVPRG